MLDTFRPPNRYADRKQNTTARGALVMDTRDGDKDKAMKITKRGFLRLASAFLLAVLVGSLTLLPPGVSRITGKIALATAVADEGGGDSDGGDSDGGGAGGDDGVHKEGDVLNFLTS
jgi:hypothetical protein